MEHHGPYLDTYYVHLKNKEEWVEGPSDFAKFHDNLSKADEDSTSAFERLSWNLAKWGLILGALSNIRAANTLLEQTNQAAATI
jgi:hypothetical protein